MACRRLKVLVLNCLRDGAEAVEENMSQGGAAQPAAPPLTCRALMKRRASTLQTLLSLHPPSLHPPSGSAGSGTLTGGLSRSVQNQKA